MIIERNQNERFIEPTKPKRTEIMEIARAVENEWRDLASEFAVESLDQLGRRRKTQPWPPIAGSKRLQVERFISPRVVEIKMQGVAQKIISGPRET
jgi:hypothetical protein